MSPGPAELAAAAKAVLWAGKKGAELVEAYRNRKIRFAQNPETARVIKATRGTAEFRILYRFASGRQRVLLQLGLTLRSLADKPDEVESLRQHIFTNFELEGLHLAQAVQHGALTVIYQTLLDGGLSEARFFFLMRDVLKDVDGFVFFVQEKMDPKQEASALLARLRRDSPMVFVVAAIGRARETATKLMKNLRQTALGYIETIRSGEWNDTYILTPRPPAKTT